MKDNRNPTEVYNSILYEKTAWNCSIVEAADRVDRTYLAEREGWSTVVSAPPRDYADYGPVRESAPQNGSYEPPEVDDWRPGDHRL